MILSPTSSSARRDCDEICKSWTACIFHMLGVGDSWTFSCMVNIFAVAMSFPVGFVLSSSALTTFSGKLSIGLWHPSSDWLWRRSRKIVGLQTGWWCRCWCSNASKLATLDNSNYIGCFFYECPQGTLLLHQHRQKLIVQMKTELISYPRWTDWNRTRYTAVQECCWWCVNIYIYFIIWYIWCISCAAVLMTGYASGKKSSCLKTRTLLYRKSRMIICSASTMTTVSVSSCEAKAWNWLLVLLLLMVQDQVYQ